MNFKYIETKNGAGAEDVVRQRIDRGRGFSVKWGGEKRGGL
jgi:hypothetical protein